MVDRQGLGDRRGGHLVALVLIAKFTAWGRQFWRVTRGYFVGRDSVMVWVWLAGLLLSVMIGVRLSVLFTYQGSDMSTSFQVVAGGLLNGDDAVRQSGGDGFWMSLWIFAILAVHERRAGHARPVSGAAVHAAVARLADRASSPATGSTARPYYRARFIDDTIDNPDQRIQADIDIFTAGVGSQPNTPGNTSTSTLLFGAVSSIAAMISFTAILWDLSGPVTLPFVGVTTAEGDVLDRHRLRRVRDRHRVLDRPADHQAVVQQREVQRRVPLCAGAAARRLGGGRVLPRGGRRALRASAPVRAGRRPTTRSTSTG